MCYKRSMKRAGNMLLASIQKLFLVVQVHVAFSKNVVSLHSDTLLKSDVVQRIKAKKTIRILILCFHVLVYRWTTPLDTTRVGSRQK